MDCHAVTDREVGVYNGFMVLALLSIAPLVAVVALYLEFRSTYGLQDSGLSRYRRTVRVIGWGALIISALTLMASSFVWIETPA